MPHPFRFAAELHAPLEGRTWAESARELEDLGYSTLFVPDHLHEGLGPIAAMAAAAAVTTTLRVGSLVLDCDFRHPAIVGRELSTIDLLSGGRLEIGLGAGWKTTDYEQSGIVMDRPGVRVSRMIEHATILRRLFTEEFVTFVGDHYQVRDLSLVPGGAEPEGPPFLIGGGAPRLLRFAGSFADNNRGNPAIHSGGIEADGARDGPPGRIDQKVGWVREGAGDRFAGIELNAWLAVAEITRDREAAGAFLAEVYGVSAAEALGSPVALVGTVAEVVADLRTRRDRWGYSYTVVPGDAVRDFAPVVSELART